MSSQHGFTLLELMIVIAIIAILGAIAVPAYQRYLQKAAMTDVLQAVTPIAPRSNCVRWNRATLPPAAKRNWGWRRFRRRPTSAR